MPSYFCFRAKFIGSETEKLFSIIFFSNPKLDRGNLIEKENQEQFSHNLMFICFRTNVKLWYKQYPRECRTFSLKPCDNRIKIIPQFVIFSLFSFCRFRGRHINYVIYERAISDFPFLILFTSSSITVPFGKRRIWIMNEPRNFLKLNSDRLTIERIEHSHKFHSYIKFIYDFRSSPEKKEEVNVEFYIFNRHGGF